MTYEEVLKDVQGECDELCEEKECEDCEAYLIKKALEKQVPKKPLRSGIFYDCPNCLETVGHVTPRGRLIAEHHCKCGQAINWSEE